MKIENDILSILERCSIEGNAVRLPNEQLDRSTYQKVNKALELIGGKWNKSAKAHLFQDSPLDIFDNLLLTGQVEDIKKVYQYFPTPKNVAKRVIEEACISKGNTVLEPSAGQGSLLSFIPEGCVSKCYELMPDNAKVLAQKNIDVECIDFMSVPANPVFDRVVMNPPFTKQQDIDHVLHAYNFLKPGGILVAIVSESCFFRDNKKSVEFRELLSNIDSETTELEIGAFKESGTMVKTRIIKLIKSE